MLTDHLEKLVHFVGIVRAGSIRKYAVLNSLSQPAMSKCLRILETELEANLVYRGKNGVRLSQSGSNLYTWSEKMLSEAEELGRSLRAGTGRKLTGTLTMGTYQSIAVYFVPQFFKFIQTEQSQLSLSFVTAPSTELLLLLKSGKVDFIISIDPPKSAELYQSVLYHDYYSLYRPTGDLSSKQRPSIFTLLTARDSKGRSLKSYLKKESLIEQTVPCSDFEGAKAMLEAGAGWAILPDRVAAASLEAKRIDRVQGNPELQFFGKHSVVFSSRSHRASDESIKWIAAQLSLMLNA